VDNTHTENYNFVTFVVFNILGNNLLLRQRNKLFEHMFMNL